MHTASQHFDWFVHCQFAEANLKKKDNFFGETYGYDLDAHRFMYCYMKFPGGIMLTGDGIL